MSEPIYILGPCAAESREQVMETASRICDLRFEISNFTFIFRAGVWKPRTSPNSFQGSGEEGLKWLQEVKARLGVPVATEVATPEHVQAALEAGIDYLWIGARTSANPIAVQSIAERICDLRFQISNLKAIFIKNPVNADAALWLGNIERIEKAVKGLPVTGYRLPVIAIHRGCGHQPCWAMAHTVRLARPDIPMLLDPSHMSGDASQVPALLEKIPELGLNGAMVEVHCNPEFALSDGKQQIRPEELRIQTQAGPADRIQTASLTEYRPATPDRIQNTELNWLRAEIDELDERLWDTIAARMDVSRRIGEWKKAHGVAPLQPERYQQIVERLRVTGYGLSDEFMLRVWDLIHEESLKQQS